jgi:hypothetical protein
MNLESYLHPYCLLMHQQTYWQPKRTTTETAAIINVSKMLNIVHEDNYKLGRGLLVRIVMLLTKMAQKPD